MQLQVTGDDVVLGIKPNKGRKEAVGREAEGWGCEHAQWEQVLAFSGEGLLPMLSKGRAKATNLYDSKTTLSTTSQWGIFLLGKNFPVEIIIKAY